VRERSSGVRDDRAEAHELGDDPGPEVVVPRPECRLRSVELARVVEPDGPAVWPPPLSSTVTRLTVAGGDIGEDEW